jgi:hypothetical protein
VDNPDSTDDRYWRPIADLCLEALGHTPGEIRDILSYEITETEKALAHYRGVLAEADKDLATEPHGTSLYHVLGEGRH